MTNHSFVTNSEIEVNENLNTHEKIDVILIGNRYVGKTSLLFQLTANGYTETYIPTIGVDHRDKLVETQKGKKVNVKLWDTSGDERSMENIAKDLYRYAEGIIIMYDVTDVKSYNDIYHWMKVVENHALNNSKLLFLGNKIDLKTERQISKTEGIYMASSYNGKYMEISVSNNRNINKMFQKIISNICD